MWRRERSVASDRAAKRHDDVRAGRRPTSRVKEKGEKKPTLRRAAMSLSTTYTHALKKTCWANKIRCEPVKVTCRSTTNAATPWILEIFRMSY
jgi:hypothetical protein